jgi:hypothetical protein
VRFFEPGRCRITICSTIADISAPTVAELNAGTMISGMIPHDGLGISHETASISRTRWYSNSEIEAPSRYKITMLLKGYRHIADADNVLWNLFPTFRAHKYVVVRRGPDTTTAWAAGNVVEVYEFYQGKRTPDTAQASSFTVPLFVAADNDDATVAA